ncbi:MAG TPA: c-type cytochrome [Sideroxyarcus sp.]|nr:c-type cytochrome [Sideroxyarcus sp.]
MKTAFFLLCLLAATAHAAPFAKGNAENGKKLFAKYDCNSCHQGKVGGDGNAIFTRPDRIVTSADVLTDRLVVCSGAIGKALTEQEKLDLAAHLNKNFYHFK